jgi:hypothetical protein
MVSSEGACAAYYLYRRMSVPASGTSGSVPAQATGEEKKVTHVG